jgi:hypothetical protein
MKSLQPLAEIDGAVSHHIGFPRVDWGRVFAYLAGQIPESDSEGYSAAAEEYGYQWFELLCDQLGPQWRVYSSEHLTLMSDSEAEAQEMLELGERARGAILDYLDDVAHDTYGREFIVRFPGPEEYYSYISYFDDEGEYGGSVGLCVGDPFPHIVLSVGHAKSVLVHELVHTLMRHLDAPLWIEEGIACIVDQRIVPMVGDTLTREKAGRARAWAHRAGLQEFWEGSSFGCSDGQQSSYTIAAVLIANLLGDHRRKFSKFVHQASPQDGGAGAARTLLGDSLQCRAAQFLGEGSWEPQPDEWPVYHDSH